MIRSVVGAACVAIAACLAAAVQPATWSHSTEADFAAGKLDKTAVTSLGEVMLARATVTLLEPRKDIGMISAMALSPRGRLFLAAAPGGKVYRHKGGKLVKFAELPGVLVRCLAFEKDTLIAGTSGKGAGLYRIDAKGKAAAIWAPKDITYVWAVVPGPGGSYYVATGAKGKLYHVRGKGKAAVIYDSDDENILSLARGPKGTLYAGTGENGLVIEIDPARKKGRVLYDAAETEISAIVVAPDGVVYAATSDSTKAGPSGEAPSTKEAGSPAGATPPGVPAGKQGAGKTPGVNEATTAPSQKRPGGAQAAALPRTRPAGKAKGPRGPGGSAPAGAPRPRPGGVIMVRGRPGGGKPSRPPRPSAAPAEGEGKGNAVYRIDAEGFVRPVFRRPVTILDMGMHDDVLTLATGHGGQVFAVDVTRGRISMLVKLDPKDVMVLTGDGKGKLYVGTADRAAVYAIEGHLARKGALVSGVLDAKQVAGWGTVRVRADIPAGCRASIAVRTGNVAKPDEKTWSSWSRETPAGRGWTKVIAPAARFLQYRLSFVGNAKASPAVDQVELVYQVRNLPPIVRAVRVVPGVDPKKRNEKPNAPKTYRMVQVEAGDGNGDPLTYAVHFRRFGQQRWIKLVEKLRQPRYVWDTTAVGDGVYELRVEASDAAANPPDSALTAARISRPVVVDNSGPVMTGLAAKPAGKGEVAFSGTVADATSRVVRIDYSVDTNLDWVSVLPADGICDSQKEAFSVRVSALDSGAHRLAVRAVDEYNNVGYGSVEVTIEK